MFLRKSRRAGAVEGLPIGDWGTRSLESVRTGSEIDVPSLSVATEEVGRLPLPASDLE
jgi:hypothetical protein